MATEVVMPKFGLTMVEGTIQQWFKSEGERVEEGERLFEVETEKVLYEVEAPAAGTVVKIFHPSESTVEVGKAVAVIAADGENFAEVTARYRAGAPEAPAAPAAGRRAPVPAAERTDLPGGRRPVTPAARKLAQERGIDVSQVEGTGPGGRVTREDVEKLAARPAQPAAAAHAVPLRGPRKVIAQRMVQSLQTAAQLTITSEADVTLMVERRKRLETEFPLTYNDLLVEAVAHALQRHPRVNATLEGDSIHPHDEVHIGIAVSLEDGLIVPVIRNANRMSLREIAEEARRLADGVRAGSLSPDDLTGGTFTISNLGAFGVGIFTPILHLPQVAILGVGAVQQKPAVHEDRIAIRHLMTLSLTFDHRALDGAPAALFLRSVIEHLTSS